MSPVNQNCDVTPGSFNRICRLLYSFNPASNNVYDMYNAGIRIPGISGSCLCGFIYSFTHN